MKGEILSLTYKQAKDFLLPKHYSGRTPSISFAYGWFIDKRLVAVCSFGKPASNSLCEGVCGKEFSSHVYELNRLCRVDDLTEQLSSFVGGCLRRCRADRMIIISYADRGMNHNGYIYQATNFIYTGATKSRTDKYTEGNKHSRHYNNDEQKGIRKVRTSKHRYIYFASYLKTDIKKWKSALNYPVMAYPKEENKNYTLGEYQQVQLVTV